MSTYYEYQDVKVLIAHRLFNMEGWKVYGYEADNSDPMTDYWDPAYWGGIAEKNGYKLVVDCSHEAKERRYMQTVKTDAQSQLSKETAEKIAKLEQMTIERGATPAEAETAKKKIELLRQKTAEAEEKLETVEVVEPGHLANPQRCNWHIEKDGIIIEKGSGLLKFSRLPDITFDRDLKDWQKFNVLSEEEWKKDYISSYRNRWNESEETIKGYAEDRYSREKETYSLLEKFNALISKWNAICGGMMGNETEFYTYEKVTVTEYKKENKAVEDSAGNIKDGQCFIVKVSFNYGHSKGYVYRIHATEYNGKTTYCAYKLNGKLTKECTGTANQSNYWYITENFVRWFEKGALAWCHIEEVKTPYEVEKVVKKTVKANKTEKKQETSATTTETTTTEATTAEISNLHFEISEDTDTRTNEKIYLVKVAEKLNREDYIKVNQYIKSLGGYYSRFKHAFLFKENPAEKLNAATAEAETEPAPTEEKSQETTAATEETEKESISYTIEEDIHTQTGKTIWIVKPEKELNKTDFAEVKRKFATIQGYYSTFKHGFIFKYNPEKTLASG